MCLCALEGWSRGLRSLRRAVGCNERMRRRIRRESEREMGSSLSSSQFARYPVRHHGRWTLTSTSLFCITSASCTQYLCPRTLSCVSSPSHCPCPFPQQIRCAYADHQPDGKSSMKEGGHFCVQAKDCKTVDGMRRLGTGFRLQDLKI